MEGNKTMITHFAEIDFGGSIPAFVVTAGMKDSAYMISRLTTNLRLCECHIGRDIKAVRPVVAKAKLDYQTDEDK